MNQFDLYCLIVDLVTGRMFHRLVGKRTLRGSGLLGGIVRSEGAPKDSRADVSSGSTASLSDFGTARANIGNVGFEGPCCFPMRTRPSTEPERRYAGASATEPESISRTILMRMMISLSQTLW